MHPWLEFLVQWLTLTFMLLGLIGLIIPVFPGLVVIWLSALIYTLIENAAGRMDWIGWTIFAAITILMLVGSVIDNILIAHRMRGHSIPWINIGLSYLAGIIASLFLTPLIGWFAAPLTLFGAEYLRFKNPKPAFDSAKTYMIAWGWSFAAIFVIGALMIALWMFGVWLKIPSNGL
jgi:uncharacterized protein YqgC (DUF456 family)